MNFYERVVTAYSESAIDENVKEDDPKNVKNFYRAVVASADVESLALFIYDIDLFSHVCVCNASSYERQMICQFTVNFEVKYKCLISGPETETTARERQLKRQKHRIDTTHSVYIIT